MNYADIKQYDISNGPGGADFPLVSGCTHRCKNCFNEEAWDFNYGKPFTGENIDQDFRVSGAGLYLGTDAARRGTF